MAKTLSQWQRPGIKFRPAVQRGFRRGIDQLVNAIRPTLGPYPRQVVNQPMIEGKRPELLDDGAVIARRIVMLPDRVEDVGAMYLREMLWTVHETAGDGAATAAVLFQTIYAHGLRYVAAGGNAMLLRRSLEAAAGDLRAELDRRMLPLDGLARLTGYAQCLCHDVDLAQVLAQAFDLLGADGRLEIRPGRGRKLVLELFDGLYWDGGLQNHHLAGTTLGKITLVNPTILISDLDVKEPSELVPLLELAAGAGIQSLLLVVARISERALALLLLPANRRRIQVVAVKVSLDGANLQETLGDICLLTGGRPMLTATGDRLEAVRLENLGRARRAWADQEYVGLEAGQGDPRQLRRHIAALRQSLALAQDLDDKRRLHKRLSRLINGSAVLWVGAATLGQIEDRKDLARRTAAAMRGALREGVLPGGGVALLDLKPRLAEKMRRAQDTDERAAYRALLTAVEAPFRTLLRNAGYEPEAILADLGHLPAGHGFDVTRGEIRDMACAGIVDSAAVVKAALGHAIHSAALALTIDVVIQRANPPTGIQRS